jgi:hypothetical protein
MQDLALPAATPRCKKNGIASDTERDRIPLDPVPFLHLFPGRGSRWHARNPSGDVYFDFVRGFLAIAAWYAEMTSA